MDAFELLEVPPTASKEEIRAAYRKLARRWHPDRFMDGPERDWANDKMAQINAAYRECLDRAFGAQRRVDEETARLEQARRLIEGGQYASARSLLMGFSTRRAEWNYLFGTLLTATCDFDKAVIYLGVASRQQPGCEKYARALEAAERQRGSALRRLQKLLSRTPHG